MTLHIFNPEHDIALAANLENFTAPHAGRQLRHDLGFLPSLWAAEGDAVLVENPQQAEQAFRKVVQAARRHLGVNIKKNLDWLTPSKPLLHSTPIGEVAPWGWDKALRAQLRRLDADARLLPSDEQLANMRLLSHRHTAAVLLPQLLRGTGTVGEAFECSTETEVEELAQRYGHIVLKAPWSSSGRGLRFVDHTADTNEKTANDRGWLRNILNVQGAVMVEPYYNKVKDFGMEFTAYPDGTVTYQGLSLFHTQNGAYTGNILATEHAKREMISRYLPPELTDNVTQLVCKALPAILSGHYCGPIGVDMMIVRGNDEHQCLLHPCVEVNLRRTMGHAALALTPGDDDIKGTMRIEYINNRYKLKISKLYDKSHN